MKEERKKTLRSPSKFCICQYIYLFIFFFIVLSLEMENIMFIWSLD